MSASKGGPLIPMRRSIYVTIVAAVVLLFIAGFFGEVFYDPLKFQ